MKAYKIIFFSMLLPFFALAQDKATISFALDTIQRDSFFLIETFSTTNGDAPRPVETITPQLFKSPEQLDTYVSYLEGEAKKAQEQAQKYAQAAQVAGLRAQLISQLKAQHHWWGATPQPISEAPIPTKKTAPTKKAPKKQ